MENSFIFVYYAGSKNVPLNESYICVVCALFLLDIPLILWAIHSGQRREWVGFGRWNDKERCIGPF